ncbi:hypothetical protein BpHYR1_012357 [Brachionus plicatilis]|uniref:Uncharacterized protein n=1 Tax=Brachionus plicatilis TaxID=10195 RepID=A0A3M7Q548_BRAPC|nr:hypothetical protein BpHYR1_012357 [Brachionus plicatilis]
MQPILRDLYEKGLKIQISKKKKFKKKQSFRVYYSNNTYLRYKLNSDRVGKICEIDEFMFPKVKHMKDLSKECVWVFEIVERVVPDQPDQSECYF